MRDRTVDVGHVHTLTEPGGPCRPDCPHPDHAMTRLDCAQGWRFNLQCCTACDHPGGYGPGAYTPDEIEQMRRNAR